MSYRKEKIEEQIRRIVSELLIREIKDPRIGFATITGVELSKDHSEARIGVSVLGDPRDIRKTIEGMKSASPFIQHRVGKALGIRITPKILFYLDSSIAEGTRMVGLLNNLEETESRKEQGSVEDTDDIQGGPDDDGN